MTNNKVYRSLFLMLIIFCLMVLSVSSARAQYQFKIELTVNNRGSVIPKEGVATVKGKVICSQPAQVYLSGDIERRIGRVYVRGSFYKSFWCDGITPWTVKVAGENGLFVAGKVQASVYTYGFTYSEFSYDEVHKTVRLKGEKPPKPYYSAMVDPPNTSNAAITFGLLGLGLIAGLVLVLDPKGGWKRHL